MAAVGEHASFIGRPRLEVDMDVLAYYVDHCFTVKQMSHMLGVSLRTVERRLQTYDLSIREQYSAVCDDELSTFIAPLLNGNPQLGNKSIHSRIRAHGWRVQRFRVRDIVSRLRGDMGIAPNRTVRRRAYEVPGPLHLWHIDGNHKLVRWRFVIHGGVDGFSRLIVFIGISNNNRASTVMNLFKSAVVNWGLPLRVRSDKGYENADVAMYMLEKRGVGRGSFITGKSVHNTRIERLWRDVFDQCTGPFYNLFWQLEQSNVLNPDSDIDLFALHYVFLPVLMQEIAAFQESWNRHGLRTEGNQTPLQLFIGGLEIDGQSHTLPMDISDLGMEESDGESDNEEPDITHMPVTHSPLTDLQTAELHLRYPPRASIAFDVRKDYYIGVRNFIVSRSTNM